MKTADTEVTEELLLEGCIRDLVRGVQNLRKERGLEVTDRIKLTVSAASGATGAEGRALLKKAFDRFRDYLASETLAVSLPALGMWVWGLLLVGGTAVWLVANRLIFNSLKHTPEASQ